MEPKNRSEDNKVETDLLSALEKNYKQILSNANKILDIDSKIRYCDDVEKYFLKYEEQALQLNEKGKPRLLENLKFILGDIRNARNICYGMRQQNIQVTQQENQKRFEIMQQANQETFRIMQEVNKRRQNSLF